MPIFNTSFDYQITTVNFTTHTHIFKRLFCTLKLILKHGFLISGIQIQIRFRFDMVYSINTHLRLQICLHTAVISNSLQITIEYIKKNVTKASFDHVITRIKLFSRDHFQCRLPSGV